MGFPLDPTPSTIEDYLVLRSLAVARIARGLGFRSGLDTVIIDALQEAQRSLEAGDKTRPRFLLQEDATLTLAAATHATTLPTGFLGIKDDERPHFVGTSSDTPIFLTPKSYEDAVVSQIRTADTPRGPSIYVLRTTTIDFITTADVAYIFTWSYYKSAALLTTDIENVWLANAPDWLNGEAGLLVAMDLRDKAAVEIFTGMARRGRAMCFGDIVSREDNESPRAMGSNQ